MVDWKDTNRFMVANFDFCLIGTANFFDAFAGDIGYQVTRTVDRGNLPSMQF